MYSVLAPYSPPKHSFASEYRIGRHFEQCYSISNAHAKRTIARKPNKMHLGTAFEDIPVMPGGGRTFSSITAMPYATS